MADTPEPPPPGPPPGWYDDPWGQASKRWWDGTQWTHHTQTAGASGSGGGGLRARLEAEQASAGWARSLIIWGGVAQATSSVTSAIILPDIVDDIRRSIDTGETTAFTGGNAVANSLNQIASLVLLAVGIVFLVWFYRALTFAADAGLPAKRTPGWGVAGFIIPIVNFWFPYRSAVDALPAGHPALPHVLRWWLLWIASSLLVIFVIVAALFSTAVMWVAAAVSVAVSMYAAYAAREVIDEITAAHTEMYSG
ncbi:MAG: DUF4328 domain-containing protein [Acidimicrobiia bacterium]